MATFPGVNETFGRYEILRLIGRGGMGVVHEARQRDLDRRVALKLLTPELAEDPEFRERFEREARTLAALDSPHIIQVYDAGEQDGVLFLATQLVNGRDLSTYLDIEGPVPVDTAVAVMADVAAALADAHDAGVLHRDIKPGNVLLRGSGAVFAYLCDFGIARTSESTLTRTAQVAGTLAYLAPECHAGESATVASDIYSLGCCLWAALAGEAPYQGQTEYQLAVAHLHQDVPQLEGSDPVTVALNQVLRTSMAKRPVDRYSSARQVEARLRAVVKGDGRAYAPATVVRRSVPVSPTQLRSQPRPSGLETVEASTSRMRWPLVALVALVALLLASGVGLALAKSGSSSPGHISSTSGGKTSTGRASSNAAASSSTASPSPPPDICGVRAAHPPAPACVRVRRELKRVFPLLDDSCRPAPINETLEEKYVYQCMVGPTIVRYSRWLSADDPDSQRGGPHSKYEYFKHAYRNDDVWTVRGRDIGDQWTDKNTAADKNRPYVWVAAYRYLPYSVVVKSLVRGA